MAEGSSFDIGEGWAMEPWNQEEMPVSEELTRQAAEQSDLCDCGSRPNRRRRQG